MADEESLVILYARPEVRVTERGLGEAGTNRDLSRGEKQRLAFVAMAQSMLAAWTPAERRRVLDYLNSVFAGEVSG